MTRWCTHLYVIDLDRCQPIKFYLTATSDDADSPTKTEHQKFPNCK